MNIFVGIKIFYKGYDEEEYILKGHKRVYLPMALRGYWTGKYRR